MSAARRWPWRRLPRRKRSHRRCSYSKTTFEPATSGSSGGPMLSGPEHAAELPQVRAEAKGSRRAVAVSSDLGRCLPFSSPVVSILKMPKRFLSQDHTGLLSGKETHKAFRSERDIKMSCVCNYLRVSQFNNECVRVRTRIELKERALST